MALYRNKEVAFVKASPAPTGTIEITENGTYDVSEYANANVNCAAGGNDGIAKAVQLVPEYEFSGTFTLA